MDCYCFLRCCVDILSGEQTAYEKRFGTKFQGPIMPFGALRFLQLEIQSGSIIQGQEGSNGLIRVLRALEGPKAWTGAVARANKPSKGFPGPGQGPGFKMETA